VCHRFRLTKQVDYFWVDFDHFLIKQNFWISGAVIKIDSSIKPKHLIGTNQGHYFENAPECSKRTLKTAVATQLNSNMCFKVLAMSNLTMVD
jgi:hypothetical protein